MSVAAPQLETIPAAPAPPRPAGRRAVRGLGAALVVSLPAVLTLYLSFNSGGYFPGATAVAVTVLAGAVVIRMALARDPLAGLSRPLVAVVCGLAAYSLWTLVSAGWSHSPSRALLGFDLANLYLFAVILFGSSSRSDRRVRWMAGLIWAAMLVVCAAALATRLRPDLFPIPVNLSPQRLAYPLTYWNALGLFAVLGLALAAHFASSRQQPAPVRVLATASVPVFTVTILLTFSRAAVALGPAVLVAYALLARPRGLVAAVVAALPPSALVVAATYRAGLIDNGLTSAAAAAQGRHLASTLLLACGAAALIRLVLLPVDGWLGRIRVSRTAGRLVKVGGAIAIAVALAVAGVAFSGRIGHEWRALLATGAGPAGDVRTHLDSYSLSDRLGGWRIALRMYHQNPLRGSGADTFELAWERYRNSPTMAIETHSLYLQALSELGVIGLMALAIPILVLIGTCLWRARRSSRSLWVVVGLVGLAWAVHAGIDWDWQMPAVSLPVFALLATGLSRRGRRRRLGPGWEVGLRLLVGTVAVAAALVAVRVAVSDAHLTNSVNAFNSGDCAVAVPQAQAAISTVSSRPQPYAVLGFCDLQRGRPGAAVSEMQAATLKDPLNWRYHYDLGLAEAAVHRDPRPQLHLAAALDPLETDPPEALAAFAHARRRTWPRVVAEIPPPVEIRQ
jgi:hypothetical protein